MLTDVLLDLSQVDLYGFSCEGSKWQERVDDFRASIRDGTPIPPIWVAKINSRTYQLLCQEDLPHLSADNLAGHHRAIAYSQEGRLVPVKIMTYLSELEYHADTLIQDVKLHSNPRLGVKYGFKTLK